MTAINEICTVLLGAGFFRLCGIMLSFPFPVGLVHFGVRIGIAFALCIGRLASPVAIGGSELWFAIVTEIVLGILAGIPFLLVYHGVRSWADLLESLRGHQMGLVIDPLSGNEEPPFAILCGHITLCLLSVFGLLPCVVLLSEDLLMRYPPMLVSLTTIGDFSRIGLQVFHVFLSSIFSTLLPFGLLVIIVEVVVGIIGKVCRGISLSGESYLLRLGLFSTILIWQGERIFLGFIELLIITLPALSGGQHGNQAV